MTLSVLVDYGADFTRLCPMMPLASLLSLAIALFTLKGGWYGE